MNTVKRMISIIMLSTLPGLLASGVAQASVGGCDCGSTDGSNPCVGQGIDVTVKATRNGSGYRDATFQWRFNSGGGDAYCGKFVNGDYWVAPKGSAGVEITSISGNGQIRADADPIVESTGILLGSIAYGNETPEENIIPRLPIIYKKTSSIVAAKQRNEETDGNCGTKAIRGACIDAYHVVTVLESVPKNAGIDMIRPNITGEEKVFLTLSDFDFSRLPRKSFLKEVDSAGWEEIRQRWSHSTEIFGVRVYPDGPTAYGTRYSEGGRAFRAHILHHDYASGMAQSFNNDLMSVFSSGSMESRLPALAALLSFGLDIYYGIYPSVDCFRGWSSARVKLMVSSYLQYYLRH